MNMIYTAFREALVNLTHVIRRDAPWRDMTWCTVSLIRRRVADAVCRTTHKTWRDVVWSGAVQHQRVARRGVWLYIVSRQNREQLSVVFSWFVYIYIYIYIHTCVYTHTLLSYYYYYYCIWYAMPYISFPAKPWAEDDSEPLRGAVHSGQEVPNN